MRLRLQKYPLEVRYKRGSEMYVADTLSRAYNTDTKRDIDSAVNKVDDSAERMFSDHVMLSEQKLIELQHATRNATVLQELEKAIKTGWPAVSTRNEVLKQYLQFKDELLAEDGLIIKGDRLVIHHMMRARMIKQMHHRHIGVGAGRARSSIDPV